MTQLISSTQIIGRRYHILREIGAGNMGAVFHAEDRLSGQSVALKQVRIAAEKLEYGSRASAGHTEEMALAQEFRILSSLRHPNIISVLDYGFDGAGRDRAPYFVMEMLEDASSLMETGDQLDFAGQLDLLVQLLQALTYLHRRGILHRDLKPKNVMVVDGVVKVLDFGLSVAYDQVREGEIAGTPSYMAPELWTGGRATRESDLYAVGVIAYRMFGGVPPFDTSNLNTLFNEVRERAPDLARLRAPQAVRDWVGRLMSKQPAERYGDAAEAAAALLRAAGLPEPVDSDATRESFLQAATFVGRDKELQALVHQLDQARLGHGSAILVAGESGVGKSRLIDELRTVALVQGALVLRGQALSGVSTPYAMWRAPARWLALLTHLPADALSPLHALAPDLARLCGRDVPQPAEITPEATQARLREVLEQLFREQASDASQPVLVLLEDLHWADGGSLALLHALTALADQLPLLIVATFRNDEKPKLPARLPRMRKVRLRRLDAAHTAALTRAMLGVPGENPELLDLLQRETEGNAFFLVEMVRALAEEAGALARVGQGPLPLSLLTGGVQGIVQRRLGRVPQEAQPLVRLAAVAGRELDLHILRQVLAAQGAPAPLERWIEQAADAAVLEVVDGQWRFTHHKLREVALAGIAAGEFQALSHALAEATESAYAVSLRHDPELLAYYWRNAEEPSREEPYAIAAAERALRTGAYQTAAAAYVRALTLSKASGSPERKLAQLLLGMGDACRGMGDNARAARCFRQALALCEQAGYRWGAASALNRLGKLTAETGSPQDAARLMVDGLRTAMQARAQPVALASITAMAGLLLRTGEPVIAAEYASLALHHFACDGPTHYLAERVLEQAAAQIAPEAFEAAKQRGQAAELKEVAGLILA